MRGDIIVEGSLLALLQGWYASKIRILRWLPHWRLTQRRAISPKRGVRNAQHHYDIGNDFYKLWLDPSLTYSCAYFPRGTETLEEAQFQKRELLCKKLRLEPGHTVLDIGCGWGALLFHAAEHYGVTVTGITPAREQVAHITAEAKRRNLSDRVSVIHGEWRDLKGTYDRIVSVGMFEHVGRTQYIEFLQRWRALLRDDGVSLLHTIGYHGTGTTEPWINKYIFPGGYLPALTEIVGPAEATDLRLYRAENLRPHYAETLKHWSTHFTAAREQVVSMFDEQFARMWWLYLQGSEAGFRWGGLELWQLELYGPEAKLPLDRNL